MKVMKFNTFTPFLFIGFFFMSLNVNAQCPILSATQPPAVTCDSGNCGDSGSTCNYNITVCADLQSASNVSFSFSVVDGSNTVVGTGSMTQMTVNQCITIGFTSDCAENFIVNWTGFTNPNLGGNTCSSGSTEATLPVEWAKLSGKTSRNGVQIDWETTSEINNEKFEIQRSGSTNREFQTIGKVKGNGTTSSSQKYTFLDRNPDSGVNYYRIKQFDFNGAYEHSEVIAVESTAIRSNSFRNNIADQQITFRTEQRISNIKIFELGGRLVEDLSYSDDKVEYSVDISKYITGQYFVIAYFENGGFQSEKFIKF